jgi:SAM-dependent methyltransferase
VIQDRIKGVMSRLIGPGGRLRVDAGGARPAIEVTPEAVAWAYRLFLDREPESREAVDDKVRSFSAVSDLRKALLGSPEYRSRNTGILSPALTGLEPAMEIEEVESSDDFARILEHIRLTWQFHGETEPHWSVITAEKYHRSRIKETEAEFFDTGREPVDCLFAGLERCGVDPSGFKTCLEYGCGLGRITRWLSERFDHVHGYDISAAHLDGARAHLANSGVGNVTLHHVRAVEDMTDLERVDLVYSLIVLQHNPPPVIKLIVREFLRALNPGGVAIFQVPTYRLGYRFRVREYLEDEATRHEMMEMHLLPQCVIFRIAREEGCEVLEVIEDGMTCLRFQEVSNTFTIRKPA